MVVTFRNIHDMMFENVHGMGRDRDLQDFLRNAYTVLKPGGVLGIEEHRAAPDMPLEDASSSHACTRTISFARPRWQASSWGGLRRSTPIPRIRATENVFFFPPELDPASGNTAKYAALGEADNMLVKLVKPTVAAMPGMSGM